MKKPFLKLIFNSSRSKFYGKALKLATEFDYFKQGNQNVVSIGDIELFEKWEFFNLLFWKTVDWKGTILEYENQRYQSHTDKTRIFYALQFSHSVHICNQVSRIKDLKNHYGTITQKDLILMFN